MDAVMQLIGDFAEFFLGLEFVTQVMLVVALGGYYILLLGRRLIDVTKEDLTEFESALSDAESYLSESIAEVKKEVGTLRAEIDKLPSGKAGD